MPLITLPAGRPAATPAAFSRATLVTHLQELAGRPVPFTGYLALSSPERVYLLFFFQGRPYAAGVATGERPTPLTITNLCAQIAGLRDGSAALSLHETDPVLLKSLLVFIQDEPTAKGPVSLINLEGMVRQIQEQAADALVILERQDNYNFFFFLDGTKTAAYWAENLPSGMDGLAVEEQMLLYAFQDTTNPVNAIIYQTLTTMESRDSANISLEGLVRLFGNIEEGGQTIAPGRLSPHTNDQLVLRVVKGQQSGMTFGGTFPCVMGRKDTDIIINDPMVSKRHAAVQNINGKLLLMDLNSTNGTSLNGEPITQSALKQGDLIGIGQTILVVETINLP
ncbi:MAG: FHA domain-containing protein [Trichlorobacter sp.]|jgi:hypothetical protein